MEYIENFNVKKALNSFWNSKLFWFYIFVGWKCKNVYKKIVGLNLSIKYILQLIT